MENKLFELVARRRSVRRYTNEHIDDTVIEEIMKVALTAPASFGHQPVEFVVVRDKRAIKEIAACKSLGGSQIIGADAVVVTMVKLDRGEFWIEDGAIASSYILLAAEQYDVGACWVHIRNRTGKRKSSDEEIRELLGVPEGYAVLNLVALGGKGEQKRGYTEGDFDKSKIHFERYWWLLDHYPTEEAKKRWKKTVYLDGKWIRHKTLADGDGECNYWILGDKDPDALADVRSK